MSRYLTAAEIEQYSKEIVDSLTAWQKANRGKPITQYEIKKLSFEAAKKNGDEKNQILIKKLEKEYADAAAGMGIRVTRGMHASSEIKFASADEALQHLANITGKRVVVAEKNIVKQYEKAGFESRWLEAARSAKIPGFTLADDTEDSPFGPAELFFRLNETKQGDATGIVVFPRALDNSGETVAVGVTYDGNEIQTTYDFTTRPDMSVAELRSLINQIVKTSAPRLRHAIDTGV